MATERWIEYWVSELDEFGDIIDYTAQTDGKTDRGGMKARTEFGAGFWHDNATSKCLERVTCQAGENGEHLEREYETLATRTRAEAVRS